MKTEKFDYYLPKELIAQFPTKERNQSKMLSFFKQTHEIVHGQTIDLVELLQAGDVLVFNNTKVIPARVFANKLSGGKVELLIEKIIDKQLARVMLKSNKPIKLGCVLKVGEIILEVYSKEEGLFLVKINSVESIDDLLALHGVIPLPPYMNRTTNDLDQIRYQTVFAKQKGAIAAPTAGLHFDEGLFAKLRAKGVQVEFLTLHVGIGTFAPVKVQDVKNHRMHKEYFELKDEVFDRIKIAKKENRRIIAVGTTVVRVLETIFADRAQALKGETDIFIYPGYEFKCIDCLFTNFHLPKSTLLMLISAFIGLDQTLELYNLAVKEKYRFFSYGDLMFLSNE